MMVLTRPAARGRANEGQWLQPNDRARSASPAVGVNLREASLHGRGDIKYSSVKASWLPLCVLQLRFCHWPGEALLLSLSSPPL